MKYVMRYVQFVPSNLRQRGLSLRVGKKTKPGAVTFNADDQNLEEIASRTWEKASHHPRSGFKLDVEFRSLERVIPVEWQPT